MKEITFGLIIGTRGFFNSKLAEEDRKHLLDILDHMGYNYVVLDEKATKYGTVETLEDAKKCAELFNKNRGVIDGIIVSLPNFGDEVGIVNTIKLANLNVPILIQASEDEIDKVDVSHRRDAFCGKISVCNNFYQYNIPFTDTTNHTVSIESEEFKRDIEYFANVCRVVNGLKNARIGVIGTRPAPFQTMRISEKLLQDSGITVVPTDLSYIISHAEKIEENSQLVQDEISKIKSYGKIPEYVSDVQIVKSAKLSIAIKEWVNENDIDATAIQCWDNIQKIYGTATCLPMSMMSEEGKPSACEADIGGAISMYALYLASGAPSALLDWNNNYGHEENKCVCTHCSNFPKSFIGREIEISPLDVLGESLGRENCFGGIKGKVAAGHMTFARISTDDTHGKIKAYVGEGEITDDPFGMAGGIAVCKIDNLRDLLKYIIFNGFEHHVAMNKSYSADVLKEAFGN